MHSNRHAKQLVPHRCQQHTNGQATLQLLYTSLERNGEAQAAQGEQVENQSLVCSSARAVGDAGSCPRAAARFGCGYLEVVPQPAAAVTKWWLVC